MYKLFHDKDGWGVIEKKSGLVMSSRTPESDARKYQKFLNSNKGFNGWTPKFMMNGLGCV